jgi:hypothetical protein
VEQVGEHHVPALLRAEPSTAPDCLQCPPLRHMVKAILLRRCPQNAGLVDIYGVIRSHAEGRGEEWHRVFFNMRHTYGGTML